MATYKEIKNKIAQLEKEAEALRKAELLAVITEIKAKMAEYGITSKDLGVIKNKTRKQPGKTSPARYRNKEGQTWSGRGRKPKWVIEALATGKTLEDMGYFIG
ncbi:H-NS family nucleoid-associated regulatory protein [Sulfuriferula sp. GW1]|uniref:H-NS histone family protein n=1 Tax=Sulfuriferula sp. GW1 TaxID=3345111 RepID=UPI0039AFD363